MDAILNNQILKGITDEIIKKHKKIVKDCNDKKDKVKNEKESQIKVKNFKYFLVRRRKRNKKSRG